MSRVHRQSLVQEDLKQVVELARAESTVMDLQDKLEHKDKLIRRLQEKAIANEISGMRPTHRRKSSVGKRLFDLKQKEHMNEPDEDQRELIRYKRERIHMLHRLGEGLKHLYTLKATVIRVHSDYERNTVEIKPYDGNAKKITKTTFKTGKHGDTEFNEEFTVLENYNPREGKFGVPTTLKFKVRSGKKTVGYVLCDLADCWNNTMHSQMFRIKSKKNYTGHERGQLTIKIEATHKIHNELKESVDSLNEYLARWCEYQVGDKLEVKVSGHHEIEWAPCEITMLKDVKTYRFRITDDEINLKLFGDCERQSTHDYGDHTASESELRRRHSRKISVSDSFEVQLGPPPPKCLLLDVPSASAMSRCVSSRYDVGNILQIRMLYENKSHGWTDVEVVGIKDNKTYKVKLLTQRLELGDNSVEIGDETILDNVDAKDLRPKPEVKPW